MFANDTNLFLAHKDISYLFETTNPQLEKISQWFFSNKLSLTHFSPMFHFHTPENVSKSNFYLP